MHFIVFPGKNIGQKLPVSKLSWYNKDIIESIAKSVDNDCIHYYKLLGKASGSFAVSNSQSPYSVEVILNPKTRDSVSVFLIDTSIEKHKVYKTVIEQKTFKSSETVKLKEYCREMLDHLLKPYELKQKHSISHSLINGAFCYTIKTISVAKQDGLSYYCITTNNINMPEVIIEKDKLLGPAGEMDLVVVCNNEHNVISRADFFKHYSVIN